MCFYHLIIIILSVFVWGIKFFSPFFFPLLYSLIFPFSYSPLLSLFVSILSRIYMIMGSWVGGLTDPHLHLYSHITSPTDCHSFPYLANFMNTGSQVGTIKLSCLVFRDIHISPKTFVIYNLTPKSSNSQASLYLRWVCLSPSNHPAFSYLVDYSPPIVTDLWVHGLSGSQKFQSIYRSHSSPPPSHPS